MLGLKKKLSSLVPNDARGTLQKALTVEWDGGHKAVLVDLAPTQPSPSEVELSGLSPSSKPAKAKAGYGRLADEDEEEAMFRAWDLAEEERARERAKEARTRRMVAEALGAPRKAESVLGLEASDFAHPAPEMGQEREGGQGRRLRSNNPFAAPYRHDDVDALFGGRGGKEGGDRPAGMQRTAWGWAGEGSAQPSPASSRGGGSTSSADGAAENPFR